MTPGRDRLVAGLWVVAAVAVVAVVIVAATPSLFAAEVTELYVLNESGVAADYPDDLTTGETATVVVGVHNDRPEARNYTVVVSLENRTVTEYGLPLEAGERDERRVSYTPESAGDTRFRVELYHGRPGDADPGWTVGYPVTVRS